ncbi:taurine dioxygenase [Caballeronia arationis]|jgi:taurine dioxygenase|uniref:Taurine dioxygenase, alpha-ketoglutarate-dependent n=1 Tax=Caballeronia arationis TaxID=1777142 RepID=A0A7Z7I2N6_9BURK|nr:TauD/TfdA family dioxygenase [Caballeronia arationis]SAK98733.1 taurine dioxygenase [Caballeronia arationis]SOE56210.1 Taurine dioxygenase, alpha-ketoglutarate-dependent [Caballeronia arationis]
MLDTAYETIAVHPLTRHIGAQIGGIDLTQPLSAQQVADVRRALLAHQVIFFRDQPISLDQHLALGRYFGALHVHPNSPGPDGYPEILQIHGDATTKRIAGDRWHSDVSCDEEPPLGSILHLHTLPSHGGDTLFSSSYAVYESLSPGFRTYLQGLTATHDGEPTYRQRNRLRGIDDAGKTFPKASHPVVRTHPETGRKGVFVNSNFTTHIDGVPEAESEGILRLLYERFASPEFQVRFKWEPHSIAFWDNRAVQHLAVWDYYPEVRSGYRVTISGDKPYL